VRERWGSTEAYKESEQRTAGCSPQKQGELIAAMNGIIAEFALCMRSGGTTDGEQAQALVRSWQAFISEHYYCCTDEILAGLGQMYTADERFRSNIDAHGEGTARFMSEAIAAYCAQKRD